MKLKNRISYIVAMIWGLLSFWIGTLWGSEEISIEIFLGIVVITGLIAMYIIGKLEGNSNI